MPVESKRTGGPIHNRNKWTGAKIGKCLEFNPTKDRVAWEAEVTHSITYPEAAYEEVSDEAQGERKLKQGLGVFQEVTVESEYFVVHPDGSEKPCGRVVVVAEEVFPVAGDKSVTDAQGTYAIYKNECGQTFREDVFTHWCCRLRSTITGKTHLVQMARLDPETRTWPLIDQGMLQEGAHALWLKRDYKIWIRSSAGKEEPLFDSTKPTPYKYTTIWEEDEVESYDYKAYVDHCGLTEAEMKELSAPGDKDIPASPPDDSTTEDEVPEEVPEDSGPPKEEQQSYERNPALEGSIYVDMSVTYSRFLRPGVEAFRHSLGRSEPPSGSPDIRSAMSGCGNGCRAKPNG